MPIDTRIASDPGIPFFAALLRLKPVQTIPMTLLDDYREPDGLKGEIFQATDSSGHKRYQFRERKKADVYTSRTCFLSSFNLSTRAQVLPLNRSFV